jgi:hypothetical protein
MEQLIIKIDTLVEGQPQITLNCTFMDESKFVQVKDVNQLTEKDLKLYSDVKTLIENYRG